MQLFKLIPAKSCYQLLLLAIISCVVFSVTLSHGFITTWDDDKYVTANLIIRGFSLQNIRAAFSSFVLGNYAPLHHISYMLDHTIFGLNPLGYHLHNVILHTLNGILFWLLLKRTENDPRIAFIAAFIFLLHPVQVETVAWISQRKSLLCMTFFLLSCLAYVNYVTVGKRKWYWFSLTMFALALLAKSVAVFLPFMLLAYDYLRSENRGRQLFLDKIPYAALGLLFGIIAMESQLPQQGGGRADYYGGSPYATLLTMIPVFCRYLYNLFWPVNLSADYLVPVKTSVDGEVMLCAALLASLTLCLWYYGRNDKKLYFWPLAAVLAILPAAQIIPLVTLMNDRYLYFPMLGITPLAANMLISLSDRGGKARLAAFALGICLLSLPWLARERAKVWSDGLTLWQDVLQRSPRNYIAMTSLGDSVRKQGDKESALRLYRQALALNGDYFIALNNISNLLLEIDRLPEAEGYIIRLVRKYPKYPKGFEMLGILRELSGDPAGAESAYSQALHLDPNLGESLVSLATLLLRKGDRASAEQLLNRARQLSGDSPELYYSMACLDAQSGQIERALTHLDSATQFLTLDAAMVQNDPCFTSLRSNPRFLQLINRLKQ